MIMISSVLRNQWLLMDVCFRSVLAPTSRRTTEPSNIYVFQTNRIYQVSDTTCPTGLNQNHTVFRWLSPLVDKF